MSTTDLYKVLRPDGVASVSGYLWPLPKRDARGHIRRRWLAARGPLRMCTVGLHLTDRTHIGHWLPSHGPFVVWRVDADGEMVGPDGDGKSAWRRARLVAPAIEVDTPERQRAWAAFTGSHRSWKDDPDLVGAWEGWVRLRDAEHPARPIFGVDALPPSERICAAWPTASTIESRNHARMVRRTAKLLGINPALDRAVVRLARNGQLADAFALAGWVQR